MILTRPALLDEIRAGNIVLDPYDDDLVGVNSINFGLDEELYEVLGFTSFTHLLPLPMNYRKVEPMTWEEVSAYLRRIAAPEDWEVWYASKAELQGRGDIKYHLLRPGNFYLGKTLQKIGTRTTPDAEYSLVPEMRARSTTGRRGFSVSLCAGMGDVGYCGQWTLEIHNFTSAPLIIPVGTEIGQIVFHRGTPLGDSPEYGGDDRYQLNDGSVRVFPKPTRLPKPDQA